MVNHLPVFRSPSPCCHLVVSVRSCCRSESVVNKPAHVGAKAPKYGTKHNRSLVSKNINHVNITKVSENPETQDSPQRLSMLAYVLLDSGANFTIIKGALVRALKGKTREDSEITFASSSGKGKTGGAVCLNVSSPDHPEISWGVVAHVAEDISYDILMGTNWLGNTKMDLDLEQISVPHPKGPIVLSFSAMAATADDEFEQEGHSHLTKQRELMFAMATSDSGAVGQGSVIDAIQVADSLNDEQVSQVRALLQKCLGVFVSSQKNSVSVFRDGNHEPLVLRPTSVRYTRPARLPPIPQRLHQAWKSQLDSWLESGVVEEQIEEHPYINPIVPVQKKNGSWRFTLDCRSVNALLTEENLILDRPDQIMAKISHRKYYSALDISNFYLNFELEKQSRKFTAFYDPVSRKNFQFTRSIFGLRGSAAHSVNTLNKYLQEVPAYGERIFSYVDDFVVGSDSFTQHLEDLKNLLEVLLECKLTAKPAKTVLFQDSLTAFGFAVNQSGVTMENERMQALARVPTPNSRKQLISHLASLSYYRRHFPADNPLAKFTTQLADLVSVKKKFSWTEEHSNIWAQMHQALLDGVRLHKILPSDDNIMVSVDSSRLYYGYIATVRRNDEEIIVAANSRAWEDPVTRWHNTRQELLGALRALKELQHMIIGRDCTVEVDNPYATFILQFPHKVDIVEPSALHRALLSVAHLRWKVKVATNDSPHWPLVDALSRSPGRFLVTARNVEELLQDRQSIFVDEFPANSFVARVSHVTPSLRTIGTTGVICAISRQRDLQALENEIKESKKFGRDGVVPEKFQLRVARAAHVLVHSGQVRTSGILDNMGLKWKNRITTIRMVINQCHECGPKLPARSDGAHGTSYIRAQGPLQVISIDLNTVGVVNGFDILVCLDLFTNFVMTARIQGASTSENIIRALTLILFKYAPTVQSIIMDNGRNLNSAVFRQSLSGLGIEVVNSARHNSRGQARVERTNRRLNEALRIRNTEPTVSARDFELVLADATLALNFQINDSGQSAFETLFGVLPSPNELLMPELSASDQVLSAHASRLAGLRLLRESTFRPPQLDIYPVLAVGDMVRIQMQQRKGESKLQKSLYSSEVYRIVKVHAQSRTYKLVKADAPNDDVVLTSHHRHVKLYKLKGEPKINSKKLDESFEHNPLICNKGKAIDRPTKVTEKFAMSLRPRSRRSKQVRGVSRQTRTLRKKQTQ